VDLDLLGLAPVVLLRQIHSQQLPCFVLVVKTNEGIIKAIRVLGSVNLKKDYLEYRM
jgi:hypothetical protein